MSFVLLRPPSRYRRIRAIYARGVTGNFSEPWNPGTLYQDSAGTTLVTAVEQGIGLELDTSLGAALSANLSINGTFDTDTTWSKGAGWTISGGVATHAAGSSSNISENLTTAVIGSGDTFKAVFTVSGRTAGTCYINVGGTAGTGRNANGTYEQYLVAGGNGLLIVTGDATFDGSIDNVLLYRLPGNHLIQATGASEPIWKQDANGKYYEYYDGIDNNFTCATGGGSTTAFSLQAAIMLEGAAAAQTIWSDAGANIGIKIERDASNQIVLSGGNGVTFVPATSAAQTVGAAAVLTCKYNGTLLSIRINKGTPVTAAVTLSAGTAGFTVGKANGAASSYFNGRMYGRAYFKNYLLTDAEENAGIEFLAAKAGITL